MNIKVKILEWFESWEKVYVDEYGTRTHSGRHWFHALQHRYVVQQAPYDHRYYDNGYREWEAIYNQSALAHGSVAECQEACQRHHEMWVMSQLEVSDAK